MKAILLSVLVAACLVSGPLRADDTDVPHLEGALLDSAGALSRDVRTLLVGELLQFYGRTHRMVVLYIPKELGEQSVEAYADRVARVWRQRKRLLNDAVILTLVPEARDAAISIGPLITDKVSPELGQRVLQEIARPALAEGDTDRAARESLHALFDAILGREIKWPEPGTSSADDEVSAGPTPSSDTSRSSRRARVDGSSARNRTRPRS